MKALSLSRPWPWSFMHAGKRIENRSRKDGRMPSMCRHRGPLLLHAAKSWDKSMGDWFLERFPEWDADSAILWQRNKHPAGVIFARCTVVAHLEPFMCDYCDGCGWVEGGEALRTGCRQCHGRGVVPRLWLWPAEVSDEPELLDGLDLRWWMGGYALVLADIEPTPRLPCRGMLGLWTPPNDVHEQLELAVPQ